MKCVLFIFAGREKYLEVQRPYLETLLARFAGLEIHLWNFSRNSADNRYLQGLAQAMPRTRIFNDYYEGENPIQTCSKRVGTLCACVKCRVGKWSEPYKYYAGLPDQEETAYVKLDDDIVFIDTERFGYFVEIARSQKGKVISANVMNNGVCTLVNPGLLASGPPHGWAADGDLDAWWKLCTSPELFRASHQHFLRNRAALTKESPSLIQLPRTRFSINTLAFGQDVMQIIAHHLGGGAHMNDEHVVSAACDIQIFKGFVTSHLHFADQRAAISDDEEAQVLAQYAQIARGQARCGNQLTTSTQQDAGQAA